MEGLQVVIAVLVVAVVAAVVVLVVWRARRVATRASLPEAPPRPGGRLAQASHSLGGALRGALGRSRIDGTFWDGLEEALIGADVGVAAASDIVGAVRAKSPSDPAEARGALSRALVAEMSGKDRAARMEGTPAIVLVVGVNGSGKTTSIAKLAACLLTRGLVPLLGAADTFRAAAGEQLRSWGESLGVDVVGGQEGADPASVAFDAYQAARSRGRDVVLVDTAGRLHSKNDLMAELTKVRRVLEREAGAVDEVLLVLDATAGQNGIAQVAEFASAVGVTGIVLTKLDGTARGGVVVAVERQLDVPVKYVGLGEGIEDMAEFDPEEFVSALLADSPVRR